MMEAFKAGIYSEELSGTLYHSQGILKRINRQKLKNQEKRRMLRVAGAKTVTLLWGQSRA